MARRKSAENVLKEAIEADDNLAILKATRSLIVKDIIACDEPTERVKLYTSLTQTNREIIKLEGTKEKRDENIETAYNEISALRKIGLGDIDADN